MCICHKTTIVNKYIAYQEARNAYQHQNFWLIIAGTLSLICFSLIGYPWVLWHGVFYLSVIVAYIACIRGVIKNRGIILARHYNHLRMDFYRELDKVLDELIESDEIDCLLKEYNL